MILDCKDNKLSQIRETCQNLLFLGTERGLFCSIDGGESWFRMKNHIPDYCPVRDIQIHPRTNDLILGTYGRGIMIVDDITPIRNMSAQIADKDIYLYPMDKLELTFGKYEGGFPEHDGWVSGNSAEITPIEYYFKKRIMNGDVSIKIFDANGKMLRELPATKRKRLNKVTWDLRITGPKTATGGTKPDEGSFIAPMVLPGKYVVKLYVGDSTYSETINAVAPKSGKMTDDDRKAQYDAAVKCMSMHENLARIADTLNAAIEAVKVMVESDKGNKKLHVFYDSLKSFKGTLLANKQTSIFADEERLREKITKVYEAICYQEARPTNLQTDNIDFLDGELTKANVKEKVLMKEYNDKWKNRIKINDKR